jgi:hypothetical protein
MAKDEAIRVLTRIISPIVGEYLAKRAAKRLYEFLSAVDKEAMDSLLKRAVA